MKPRLSPVLLLLAAGCVAAPPPPPPPAPVPPAPSLGGLPLGAPATTRGTAADPVSLLSVPDTVFFAFNEATPRPDAGPALDALARRIAAAPANVVLTVAGNTDAVGSDSYNQALSLERAESVVAALAARGIPPARLHAVGFGRTRPVASNSTDEGRARNRRVELALSSSFAANAAALTRLVPPERDVPDAAIPEPVDPPAAAPVRATLARTPARLDIHANTPERVKPHALGPDLTY